MTSYSITRLRADLYRVLDGVAETGVPVEIERNGQVLRIVRANRESRLAKLTPHLDYLATDPESLVHVDWSDEWRP